MKVHVNTMSVSWAWPIKGSLAYSYHSCFQWLPSITGAPAVLLLKRCIWMTKIWSMSTMMLKWCKSDAEMMWWTQLPPNCQYLQLNVCRYSLNKVLRLLAPTSVWSEPSTIIILAQSSYNSMASKLSLASQHTVSLTLCTVYTSLPPQLLLFLLQVFRYGAAIVQHSQHSGTINSSAHWWLQQSQHSSTIIILAQPTVWHNQHSSTVNSLAQSSFQPQ